MSRLEKHMHFVLWLVSFECVACRAVSLFDKNLAKKTVSRPKGFAMVTVEYVNTRKVRKR